MVGIPRGNNTNSLYYHALLVVLQTQEVDLRKEYREKSTEYR